VRFRAFISVDIKPSEKLIGTIRDLMASRADLKIVRPELLHLTLKFLGDTEESMVGDVLLRMSRSVEGIESFDMRLKGMGAFPSMSNIRVVWVGIEDGQLLKRIADRLDSSLSDLGFERDRKGFVPHLTLARTRSGRNIANVQALLQESATREYGEYRVDRILLKKSVLSPQGPTYSTVGEQLLGDGTIQERSI
jgi:2'-5' RNA ligase